MHRSSGSLFIWIGLLASAFTSTAFASSDGWEVVTRGKITVKVRAVPNSRVQEIWAETTLAASVTDLQKAILDDANYPRFMPFVKETKRVGAPSEDGSFLVYTRIGPPLVAHRDYVIRVSIDAAVADDGSGSFHNHWAVVPNILPAVRDVVRLSLMEGSWEIAPAADGRSKVTYRFRVDPGGWVPTFVADIGNRTGVQDVLTAVEKEAQRHAAERAAQQPPPPAPETAQTAAR